MHRTRRPLVAALLAAVLGLGGLVAAGPADAADPVGQVRLHVVDAGGQPSGSGVFFVSTTDPDDNYSRQQGFDGTASLAPGRYGVVVATQWGGITCVGVTPCGADSILSYSSVSATPDAPIVVTDGGVTDYTVTMEAPAVIGGTPQVGGELTLTVSPSMQRMIDLFHAVSYTGEVLTQWTRDGVAIPGANARVYRPATEDAGHVVGATLSMDGVLGAYLALGIFGGSPDRAQVAVAGMSVARVPTQLTIALSRSRLTTRQQTAVRVDVSAGGVVPTGTVSLVVGTRTYSLALLNGTARVRLPRLKAGSYAVSATYAGDSTCDATTAAPKTFVVKAVKKKHKKHKKHPKKD